MSADICDTPESEHACNQVTETHCEYLNTAADVYLKIDIICLIAYFVQHIFLNTALY